MTNAQNVVIYAIENLHILDAGWCIYDRVTGPLFDGYPVVCVRCDGAHSDLLGVRVQALAGGRLHHDRQKALEVVATHVADCVSTPHTCNF